LYENFQNLSGDKKKRILDICIEEFAKNGYEGASTNEIIKRAGISKGILFHYFGNKKNLYLYIVDYILEYALNKFYSDSEELSSDLFQRIIQTGMRKLKIAYEEPLVHELLYKTFIDTPDDLKDDVKTRYMKLYNKEVPNFFEDMDTSLLRGDIDPKKAIEVVLIFMEGLQAKYLNQYKNQPAEKVYGQLNKIMEECSAYMEILKKGIYK
jgi:TetR/AcrR family transcriptional regulator